MGMATQQNAKSSPRGRATERRDKNAATDKKDKNTRRKEGRAKKRKQVDSREEYEDKHGEEEEEEPKKKKKKKSKKEQLGPDGEPVPQKLTVRGLKPRLWESETLLPFRRDVHQLVESDVYPTTAVLHQPIRADFLDEPGCGWAP